MRHGATAHSVVFCEEPGSISPVSAKPSSIDKGTILADKGEPKILLSFGSCRAGFVAYSMKNVPSWVRGYAREAERLHLG
jgi:hypothetical protein